MNSHTSDAAEQQDCVARLEDEFRDFAYLAVHDLAAPVRHVRGYLDLVRGVLGDAAGEQVSGYLERALAAAEDCASRLDDLLDVSRIQAEPLTPALTPLADIFAESRVRTAALAREMNACVHWEGGGDVLAHSALLSEALCLIVSALLKHRDFGDAQPILCISRDSQPDAPITIVDNGAALSPDVQKLAFRMSLGRSQPGADRSAWGKDLALARRICRRHGGDLMFVKCDANARLELRLAPESAAKRDAA